MARTLEDLAALPTPHQLERACHRAETARLLDTSAIEAVLARAGRPRGVRALRAALSTLASAEPAVTRRELEERFLALVARESLPRPMVNARVAGHEVDFLWPVHRLIAETDGAATHLTPTAFEVDRRRDSELLLAGFRVVRFTWRQVVHEPDTVSRTLRALLKA